MTIGLKFRTPRALQGRESRSDERARAKASPHILGALPLARLAHASIVRAERNLPLADCLELLGYDRTADKLARHEVAKNAAPMSEGDATAGGSFVPTDVAEGFINSLEHLVAVRSLIPATNVFRTRRPELQWRKVTQAATGAWVGDAPSSSNLEIFSTGAISIALKKMRIEVLISRDLVRDADNFDGILAELLLQAAARLEDLALVEGLGTQNQPRGLKRIAGDALSSASGTVNYANARADLRKLLTTLRTRKVPGSRAFIGAAAHREGLEDLVDGIGRYPFSESLERGQLLGVPAVFSTQLSTSDKDSCFYAVVPEEMLFAEHADVTIESDGTYVDGSGNAQSASAADCVCVRLWRRIGFALRHPEAAAYLDTVKWAAKT